MPTCIAITAKNIQCKREVVMNGTSCSQHSKQVNKTKKSNNENTNNRIKISVEKGNIINKQIKLCDLDNFKIDIRSELMISHNNFKSLQKKYDALMNKSQKNDTTIDELNFKLHSSDKNRISISNELKILQECYNSIISKDQNIDDIIAEKDDIIKCAVEENATLKDELIRIKKKMDRFEQIRKKIMVECGDLIR